MEGWKELIGDLRDRIIRLESKQAQNAESLIDRKQQINELKSAIREEVTGLMQTIDERLDRIEKQDQRNKTNEEWRKRIGGWVIAVGSSVATFLLTWLISNWEKLKAYL